MGREANDHELTLPPAPKYPNARWRGGHLARDPDKVKGDIAEAVVYSPVIGAVMALLGFLFVFKRRASRGGAD